MAEMTFQDQRAFALFVDHSQVVQLEGLRSGIWGTKDLFGRVLTYKKGADPEPHAADH